MRRSVIKQIALKSIQRDVFSKYYDQRRIIYIHCPKTGGTSISYSLFGGDPWHYTISELERINSTKCKEYFKFSWVRNPWSRILSTYNYAPKDKERWGNSPIDFLLKFDSFEDFVLNGLTRELVSSHYFFWPYSKYLNFGLEEIDFVGKFEEFQEDWNNLSNLTGLNLELKHLNKSGVGISYSNFYTPYMQEKVRELYKDDVDSFDYEF